MAMSSRSGMRHKRDPPDSGVDLGIMYYPSQACYYDQEKQPVHSSQLPSKYNFLAL